MSKRFIDTDLFDDEWFMSLSIEGKLTWIYLITTCDHAGIVKVNTRLFNFQTGIKDFNKVLDSMSDRVMRIADDKLFIPKFIDFQYPGFPNSKVKAQDSALKILTRLGLYSDNQIVKQLPNSYLTVRQELPNSYDNGNEYGNEYEYEDTAKKKFCTLDDVRRYCFERKNGVDPERFYNYYESNGWMVGRNKMKDWKAAVRTWERNQKSNEKNITDAKTIYKPLN